MFVAALMNKRCKSPLKWCTHSNKLWTIKQTSTYQTKPASTFKPTCSVNSKQKPLQLTNVWSWTPCIHLKITTLSLRTLQLRTAPSWVSDFWLNKKQIKLMWKIQLSQVHSQLTLQFRLDLKDSQALTLLLYSMSVFIGKVAIGHLTE